VDTKSLQIFQHLAHSLHFGKTANAHHMSPSTLSRMIQRMEQQLNCQLLERDNRSVLLTSSGKQLLDYAEQQLQEWQQLQSNIDHQQTILSGKLHIFCSVTAAYSHLPPLLDRFRQQHPEVEIMLTTGDAADAISRVQDGAVDVAIAAKPQHLPQQLSFQPIAKIPLAVIAPTIPSKVRQQIRQIDAQDLDWPNIPIILAEHGPTRKCFDDWYLQKQKGQPNIYAKVSGHEALVSMVALGCGIGVAPKVVVENSPVKNRVEYLTNVGTIAPFELGLCCQQKRLTDPIITSFLTPDS